MDLLEEVRRRAADLGFDAIGVARADEPLLEDFERYRAFVDGGLHGDMGWLADDVEARRRLDGDAILAGAKSVVCLATRYARGPEAEARDPELVGGVARYARGHDYHNHVRKRLRRLAAWLRTLAPGARARPLQDVEPILERAWAARSGLGFVGKNGLIIVPGQGSYVLLGEVVTTLELPADTPLADRCGSCTRCLDACPTGAFRAPWVLDPRRCVSYWTIEARSEVPVELRGAVGEHLFGCDVCQEVCPFNRTATPPSPRARSFAPLAVWSEITLDEIATASEEELARRFEGSAVRRAGARLGANAALHLARSRRT